MTEINQQKMYNIEIITILHCYRTNEHTYTKPQEESRYLTANISKTYLSFPFSCHMLKIYVSNSKQTFRQFSMVYKMLILIKRMNFISFVHSFIDSPFALITLTHIFGVFCVCLWLHANSNNKLFHS